MSQSNSAEKLSMCFYRIINGCIVFRLSSASLFKNFPDEIDEEDSFKWSLLPEVIYMVLPRLAGLDRL